MSHFEGEFDKYKFVSNYKFLQLQKRVSLLEGPSTDIIQNDTNIGTVIEENVKGDVKPDEVLVHINDNSRNVLLKSPERVNDDSWVHVDSLINDV